MSHRWRLRPWNVLTFILGTCWLVVVLAPIYFMVLASLRTQGDYLTANPWLPTGPLTTSEYSTVFDAGLGTYLVNSLVVTASCIVLTVGISLGASFRIVRRTTRASGAFLKVLLFGLAVPIQAIIVPLYLLVDKMHLYDTLQALVLVMSASAIPVSVLIMLSYIRDIPRELLDAMSIDGANEWKVFAKLIWPLSLPVLATVAIYDGLNVWNNFLLPLILTQSSNVSVLPLGLYKFEGTYGIDVPAILAAVVLSVLPLLVLYVGMRRQMVRGIGGFSIR